MRKLVLASSRPLWSRPTGPHGDPNRSNKTPLVSGLHSLVYLLSCAFLVLSCPSLALSSARLPLGRSNVALRPATNPLDLQPHAQLVSPAYTAPRSDRRSPVSPAACCCLSSTLSSVCHHCAALRPARRLMRRRVRASAPPSFPFSLSLRLIQWSGHLQCRPPTRPDIPRPWSPRRPLQPPAGRVVLAVGGRLDWSRSRTRVCRLDRGWEKGAVSRRRGVGGSLLLRESSGRLPILDLSFARRRLSVSRPYCTYNIRATRMAHFPPSPKHLCRAQLEHLTSSSRQSVVNVSSHLWPSAQFLTLAAHTVSLSPSSSSGFSPRISPSLAPLIQHSHPLLSLERTEPDRLFSSFTAPSTLSLHSRPSKPGQTRWSSRAWRDLSIGTGRITSGVREGTGSS